jgi:hypothetical protein
MFIKWALDALAWLIGRLTGQPAAPSPLVQAVAGQAVAQTQLSEEAQENDALKAAADARNADAAIQLRDPAADQVTADPRAAVNLDPNGHFRD